SAFRLVTVFPVLVFVASKANANSCSTTAESDPISAPKPARKLSFTNFSEKSYRDSSDAYDARLAARVALTEGYLNGNSGKGKDLFYRYEVSQRISHNAAFWYTLLSVLTIHKQSMLFLTQSAAVYGIDALVV